MGLREKQLIHDLKTTIIPRIAEETKGFMEVPIEWEFDEASFGDKNMAALEYIETTFYQVQTAIRDICVKEFSKGILKAGMKKVTLTYSATGQNSAVFEDSTLKLVYKLDETYPMSYDIQRVIEDGL